MTGLPTNEQENELLKNVFKGNEILLKIMRKMFYGLPYTTGEAESVRCLMTPELKRAIRKKLYPLLDSDVPIGQVADYWLGTEQQIFGAHPNQIEQAIGTKIKVLELLEKALSILEKPEPIDLTFIPKRDIQGNLTDPLQIELLARNLYIKTIETGLNFINIIANEKTPAEVKKALQKDSLK